MLARHRTWLVLGAGLAAVVVAAMLATGLLRTRAPENGGISRLEDAVTIGILDQKVVDEVRSTGRTTAFISVDAAGVLADLQRRFPDASRLLERSQGFDAAVASLLGEVEAALGDGVEIDVRYGGMPTIAVTFRSESALLAALRLPVVSSVRADRTGTTTVKESTEIIHSREVNDSGYEGDGTYVAVLDEGVSPDVFGTTWFPAGSVPADQHYRTKDAWEGDADGTSTADNHGNHVSSTVLAVAPKTKIVDIEVFRYYTSIQANQWSDGRVLDGIQHAIALKKQYLADPTHQACCNIVAMNLSLGISNQYYESECSDDFGFAAAMAVGIIPVVSSGNDADRGATYRPGISYPACGRFAMSTGATTDGTFPLLSTQTDYCEASNGPDAVTAFSQSGSLLDILAPGDCITAAGGSKEGTSMAAPHVSGAIAILAAADPGATPEQIQAALTMFGKPITDARHSPPITTMRLDVQAALTALLGGSVSVPVTPARASYDVGPAALAPSDAFAPGRPNFLGAILLRNTGTKAATFDLRVEPPGGVDVPTAPAAWFSFSQPSVTLDAGDLRFVTVSVAVPESADGRYGARIRPVATTGQASETDPSVAVAFSVSTNPIGQTPGVGSTPTPDAASGARAPSDESPALAAIAIAAVVVVGWLALRRRRPPT